MSAPISREAAQQLSPVEALRRLALETLSECDEGYCLSLRGFLSRCGARIHPEIVRGIMAHLRQDGLVAHCRGLMTEDGEMAGSGWGITPAGKAHLRALPPAHPAAPAHPDDKAIDRFTAAPAVKMKPLVWEYSETTYTADRETGRQEKAGLFWQAYCRVSTRSYTIMKLVDPRVKGDKESYRLIIGDTDQRFPSLEAAQEIANARHRARILSALEGGEV